VADSEKKAPTKARVIADHGKYKIDQIVEGPDADAGVEAGWADAHPSAVAHATKLARRKAREAADADE
jgi:hypothetical protein